MPDILFFCLIVSPYCCCCCHSTSLYHLVSSFFVCPFRFFLSRMEKNMILDQKKSNKLLAVFRQSEKNKILFSLVTLTNFNFFPYHSRFWLSFFFSKKNWISKKWWLWWQAGTHTLTIFNIEKNKKKTKEGWQPKLSTWDNHFTLLLHTHTLLQLHFFSIFTIRQSSSSSS